MISPALLGTAAFAAGAGLSTFFAPCAFPLLPGYVGYYVRRNGADSLGLRAAAAAGIGSLAALSAVAGLAFALGRALTSRLPLLEPVVGAGLVGFGLLVLVDRAPTLPARLPERPDSVFGFGAFGAAYAVAAAGCVLPLFLGVVSQASTLPPVEGGAVLAVYAGAVTAPLVGVSLLAGAGVGLVSRLSAHTRRIERAAAVVMIAAGVGQLYLSLVVLDVLSLGLG